MLDNDNYTILNGVKNEPYPVANVIVAYATLGGFIGGFIIGAIILICTLGFGFLVSIFAVVYGIGLGTPPALLTGLYLGLKRFKIVDGLGWGTVFPPVAYFNSTVCLSITFMLMNHEVSPLSQILLAAIAAIFGGCSSCMLGSKVLPIVTTKT